MGRELSHGEVRDLLGAYALDAVDDDEREAVSRHLESCEPCRREVSEHREVAALMAGSWAPAPAALWDRIAGSLEESPPVLRPVVNLDAERERRRPRPGPIRAMVGAGIAAVAAVMAVLVVQTVQTNHRVDDLAESMRGEDGVEMAADAAAHRGDARPVFLKSADGRYSADAVLLPDGSGYLVKSNLPPLRPDRTYQLWAVVGAEKISVGVLGPEAGPAAFHTTPKVAALAITEEAAGGVVASQQQPAVVGLVS